MEELFVFLKNIQLSEATAHYYHGRPVVPWKARVNQTANRTSSIGSLI
jgi:hypothetical protein